MLQDQLEVHPKSWRIPDEEWSLPERGGDL